MRLSLIALAPLVAANFMLRPHTASDSVFAAPAAKNAVLAASAQLGSVNSCTSAGARAENFVVTTNTSDAVYVGDWAALTFSYDLAAPLTDGSMYYNCTINNILPYNVVDDLCESQDKTTDPCPMAAGHHENTGVIEIPSGINSMKCTVYWEDGSGNEVLCATAAWTVSAMKSFEDTYAEPKKVVAAQSD